MEGPVLSTLSKNLASKANPGNAHNRPNLVRERNAHVESFLQQSVISSNDSLSKISWNKKALSDITYAAYFLNKEWKIWLRGLTQISHHNLASNQGDHVNTILSMTSYRLRRTIDSTERTWRGLHFSLGRCISPLPSFQTNTNCLKFWEKWEIEWVFPIKNPGHLLKNVGICFTKYAL